MPPQTPNISFPSIEKTSRGFIWDDAEVLERLRLLVKETNPQAGKALEDNGLELLAEVKETTPVLTGELQRAAFMESWEQAPGGGVHVKMGQGKKYAAKVHSLDQLATQEDRPTIVDGQKYNRINPNRKTHWWSKALAKDEHSGRKFLKKFAERFMSGLRGKGII